ncbi:hypothetical protein AGMMS49957_02580 [Synergistales bacterium]|nr:hypothetical protein AGMMS49957_02580 [Synergistales bacterium]
MLDRLVEFIKFYDGINDKMKLASLVTRQFVLVKDRSVFYCKRFAVRFCKANASSFSNTVLSLSALQKFDRLPVIICVVTPDKNYMLLANTTFLIKISHSSQKLRVDNIKGSFNGSDIIRQIGDLANEPKNFATLFAIHQNFTFEENLVRLTEATNNIVPIGAKFDVTAGNCLENIMDSPKRAIRFSLSDDYQDLLSGLDSRANNFKNEILIAACIENVNLRGRIIEYIIAGDDVALRDRIIESLYDNAELPRLVTRDGLGDYGKIYPAFHTETDIKTKIMILASAPKGYNLDKMLEFLAEPDSIFMIYFVGIDYTQKTIKTKLVSMFQNTLISNTVIQAHWAGRNSRGVSQFNGEAIKSIILNETNTIDATSATRFLEKIVNL